MTTRDCNPGYLFSIPGSGIEESVIPGSRWDYSTNLPGWGEGISVGWQITLCDPTDKWRPVIKIIIIITTTMFMVLSSWQSHCESSPGSFDECRMAPSGRRPKTKPDDLGCESACTGCQKLHPPVLSSSEVNFTKKYTLLYVYLYVLVSRP